MSYYKIAYESDTIEGLKAIQGSSTGNGLNSINSDYSVPTPPLEQDDSHADGFSDSMQAPPTADSSGNSFDISDENAQQTPPPTDADLATTDMSSEEEIAPPQGEESPDQEGEDSDAEQDEEPVPPKQSPAKSSKSAKKSSR